MERDRKIEKHSFPKSNSDKKNDISFQKQTSSSKIQSNGIATTNLQYSRIPKKEQAKKTLQKVLQSEILEGVLPLHNQMLSRAQLMKTAEKLSSNNELPIAQMETEKIIKIRSSYGGDLTVDIDQRVMVGCAKNRILQATLNRIISRVEMTERTDTKGKRGAYSNSLVVAEKLSYAHLTIQRENGMSWICMWYFSFIQGTSSYCLSIWSLSRHQVLVGAQR
jgi:hypothetical protein